MMRFLTYDNEGQASVVEADGPRGAIAEFCKLFDVNPPQVIDVVENYALAYLGDGYIIEAEAAGGDY